MAEVPEVAFERSVNLESNAFIGSILEGVVSTEGDGIGGTAEAEVALTLSGEEQNTRSTKRPGKSINRENGNISLARSEWHTDSPHEGGVLSYNSEQK